MKWMHRNRTFVAVMTMIATLLTHVAPVAAWYDPKSGRFLQRDPNGTALLVTNPLSHSAQSPTVHVWLTPQQQYGDGMNFYQYVKGNPNFGTDPSGLFTIPDMAWRMGAYGAMVGGTLGWMRSYATYADKGSDWQQAAAFFKGAGIGGATGIGMGWLAAAIGSAAGSLSVGVTAVGLMTSPAAVGLSIAEYSRADTYGERLMAGIDIGMSALGLLTSHLALARATFTPGTASPQGSLALSPFESIATHRGAILQEMSPAALALRARVERGATLWRIGTTNKSGTAEAHFWAPEHPSTPGYAQRYGIPAENIKDLDFVMSGKLKPDTPFVTRTAENGTAIEVVVPSGGVSADSFSMP